MSKSIQPVSDRLREAMKATGLPQDYFCKALDADPATISRFWNGERGLRLSVADKLAKLLNLELRPVRKARRGRKAT